MFCLPIIFQTTLAQVAPWEDPAPPAPPPHRPMSFADLQHGFQQFNAGTTDNTMRNGLLIIVAGVALVVLLVQLFQRWKRRQNPDNEHALLAEIRDIVKFGILTRLLLSWVARTVNLSPVVLLISGQTFRHAVDTWSRQPTFTPLRRWGKPRLHKFGARLFERDMERGLVD